MDVLKPELVWIDNRCYRKFPILDGEKNFYHEDDLYPTNSYEYKKEDDDDYSDLPISHEGDQFWISITIPGPLIGMVKGRHDRNKKNIEESTLTSIKIPNNLRDNQHRSFHQSREGNSVDAVIKGASQGSVYKAYRRIESTIIDGRWKVGNYTHFLSIPMNNESIKEGFTKFKTDVLNNFKSTRGICNDLFEYPQKLHLTVVMLTLFNDKEKEEAKNILNKCRTDIMKRLGGNRIQIEVRGIEYMNDDPAEVDVLYGKVRETNDDNLLQIVADSMAEDFIHSKLARTEYESVKLHVTLMKSRLNENNQKLTFDARPLLRKYSDYPFGEMTLSEIHISTRYTGNEKEYYKPATYVTL